jgi:hypothetical protein
MLNLGKPGGSMRKKLYVFTEWKSRASHKGQNMCGWGGGRENEHYITNIILFNLS